MTTRIIMLVLVALVALSEPALTIVFFVPIAGWLLWRDHDRIAELEKRLAAAEKPAQPKPEEAQPVPS